MRCGLARNFPVDGVKNQPESTGRCRRLKTMQKRSRSKDMSAPKDVIPYILAECAVATITGDCVITYWSIIGKRVIAKSEPDLPRMEVSR
jgi:hypothetical protein